MTISTDMLATFVKVAEGLSINLDGEPLEGESLRFEVRPGALRVHLPEHSPLLGGGRSINRPG